MYGTTKTTNSTALSPGAYLTSNQNQSTSGPTRPGVILDSSPDFATVAMFTTLQGKGISQVKGILRPIMATVHPAHHKRDPEAPGRLPTLAVYPTWRTPSTLCLCLKHKVPTDKLELWSWRDNAGENYRMCGGDFRLLQQLCEKNEGLRGLFASESWLFEELSLIDFMKRRG